MASYYTSESLLRGTAAPQRDVGGLLKAGDSLAEALGSFKAREVADAKRAEEQRRYDEERSWKLEDRERAAKERQADDVYYGERAKGVQTKGGIYGDALATESNKYDLTPDEILKATLYKNDASKARAAGETALADKLAWQTKVSDDLDAFLSSGVGNESRVEMHDRINSKLVSLGLPIPKEARLSADQARLAEKTAEDNEAKRLKEAKAEILKSDQANAWKYISALGNTRTVLDEDGNEVQVAGTRSGIGSSKDNSKDLAQGLASISEGIKKAGIDSKYVKTATDDALKAQEILVARGLNPKYAGELVADAIGTKETGVLFWKDNVPTIDQNNLLKYADSAIRMSERAGAGTSGSGVSTKATEAAMLNRALGEQSRQSLQSILSEQAKLARGAEGRRADSVNAWLQDRGLIDKPKASESVEVTTEKPPKAVEGEARADRNNNPGNLTGDDKWQGKVGKDGRFVQFESYELGSRALAKNLMNSAIGKTVEDYMNKYAPKSENDTKAYINNVSKALGKEPGEVITDSDILPLMKAIARQEGGKVDEKGLEAGYRMAIGDTEEKVSTADVKPTTSIKDLFNKVEDKQATELKTSNVLISTDEGLQKLREDASQVLEGSPEYAAISNKYNERVAELKDKAVGADLAAYMTRQKSGPLATKINDEIYSLLDSGLEVPSKIADFVKKGKDSVVDFNRMLMEDASKGKNYIKSLLKALEKPKLQGKEVIIPDRPN